jgi:hypothetical protein
MYENENGTTKVYRHISSSFSFLTVMYFSGEVQAVSLLLLPRPNIKATGHELAKNAKKCIFLH